MSDLLIHSEPYYEAVGDEIAVLPTFPDWAVTPAALTTTGWRRARLTMARLGATACPS
ncbi:MAG: hypothetical protein FJ210_01745 [Betaproteobacteria bacterium]|nr:hypothetical protein [Betaproteobacteria bacterium]